MPGYSQETQDETTLGQKKQLLKPGVVVGDSEKGLEVSIFKFLGVESNKSVQQLQLMNF